MAAALKQCFLHSTQNKFTFFQAELKSRIDGCVLNSWNSWRANPIQRAKRETVWRSQQNVTQFYLCNFSIRNKLPSLHKFNGSLERICTCILHPGYIKTYPPRRKKMEYICGNLVRNILTLAIINDFHNYTEWRRPYYRLAVVCCFVCANLMRARKSENVCSPN